MARDDKAVLSRETNGRRPGPPSPETDSFRAANRTTGGAHPCPWETLAFCESLLDLNAVEEEAMRDGLLGELGEDVLDLEDVRLDGLVQTGFEQGLFDVFGE